MSPEPAPQPINFGGIGDLDMIPTAAHEAVKAIYQAGRIFGPVWRSLAPAIATDERAVSSGMDAMSVNFRTEYNAYKDAVGPIADEVQSNFTTLGQGGNGMIARYLELSNQIQPAWMRSLG
jgi:hypothetical protein